MSSLIEALQKAPEVLVSEGKEAKGHIYLLSQMIITLTLSFIIYSWRREAKCEGGLHPILPSPLPPTSGWKDVNDSTAALSMLMDESERHSSPSAPKILPQHSENWPINHSTPTHVLHPPITHQCAEAELLLHGTFRMQAGRLQSSWCLHLSSPKMIPHWGQKKYTCQLMTPWASCCEATGSIQTPKRP